LESINYINRTSPRIPGVVGVVQHNRKFPVVNRCRFFSVDDLRLIGEWNENTTVSGSFHLISCVNKAIKISSAENDIELNPGQTCLIPANLGAYRILPMESGETDVLKTTL
jgi:mannose-6-phosphate isomerase